MNGLPPSFLWDTVVQYGEPMKSIFAVLIGAVAFGSLGSSWADGKPVTSATVPGPAKVDASFPKRPGNYFRISQEGTDQVIVIAVVPESKKEKPKAVQGLLDGSNSLNGESVNFGKCGSLRLGNLNATTTPLTPSPKTVLVLEGQLQGDCGISHTPERLQKMPE